MEKIWLDDIDGVVYKKDATKILIVPNEIKNITIPNNVTAIGYMCKNLTSLPHSGRCN